MGRFWSRLLTPRSQQSLSPEIARKLEFSGFKLFVGDVFFLAVFDLVFVDLDFSSELGEAVAVEQGGVVGNFFLAVVGVIFSLV